MLEKIMYGKEAMRLGLFDPVWYCKSHRDVGRHGMDPFKHYVRHGWLEGRMPSPALGEAFLRQVIPDGMDSRRNPVIGIIAKIRRGEFSEASLREAMALRERMPECGSRLIPGVTVVGFFGRAGQLCEVSRRLVKILDWAEIPCMPFKLIPLEVIAEETLRHRCLQVMNRKVAIFILDEPASRWASIHLRPGRLNVLIPCGDNDVKEWKQIPKGFDEIWGGELVAKIQGLRTGLLDSGIGEISEIIRKKLQKSEVL
jgi:hypothetical protein